MVSKAHYEGHMTSVLHTARVSNIFSIMFCNMSLNLVMGFARHGASVVLCFLYHRSSLEVSSCHVNTALNRHF